MPIVWFVLFIGALFFAGQGSVGLANPAGDATSSGALLLLGLTVAVIAGFGFARGPYPTQAIVVLVIGVTLIAIVVVTILTKQSPPVLVQFSLAAQFLAGVLLALGGWHYFDERIRPKPKESK